MIGSAIGRSCANADWLQDDALTKLYRCTQFRRTGDNSIYHIGYPINFRQQGGTPSIQFSIARTGLRADIDVDYRSSSGPKALLDGHLTSANSDVRAGANYSHHIHRWEGLGDWWRNLFGFAPAIPKTDLAALSSTYSRPRVGDSQPVQAAVQDFYKSWLVDKQPEQSLSYISVKANACIAAFSGESARDSLIRLRLLEHMRKVNRDFRDVRSLDDLLLRAPGDTGPGQILYQVWHREERTWKVVTWHLEDPFASHPPRLAEREASETGGPKVAAADPGLAPSTERFLKGWLVARDRAEALASEARPCANLDSETNKQSAALAERAWFREVAATMPRADSLAGVIQRVEFSHSQMQEISHPNQDSYLLVRVSDDLASMYNCAPRSAGAKPGPADAMGKAFYNLNVYQTLFQPRHKDGDRGTVVLTWARRQDRWMVIGFNIVTY